MKSIILKDIYVQRYLLISGIVLSLGTVLIPRTVGLEFVVMPQLILLLLVVVLSVLVSESAEEKDYGYTFLSTLPISHLDTIAAKFFLLLAECILFSLISFTVMTVKDIAQVVLISPITLSAISFAVNLLIGGVMLWGIYTFGLTNFTRGMLILMVLAQVVVFGISLRSFAERDASQQLMIFLGKILNNSPALIVGIALLLWAGLLILTAQFRKRI